MPNWDQTLIFDDIEIDGDTDEIQTSPPEILIEVFDHDRVINIFILNLIH